MDAVKVLLIVCLIIAAVASVNWVTSAYGFDLVAILLSPVSDGVDKKRVAKGLGAGDKIVYAVVGVAGAVGAILAATKIANQ